MTGLIRMLSLFIISESYLPTALGAHAALGPGGRGRGADVVPVCSLGVGIGRDAVLVVGGVRCGLLDAFPDRLLTFYEFLPLQFVQLEVE